MTGWAQVGLESLSFVVRLGCPELVYGFRLFFGRCSLGPGRTIAQHAWGNQWSQPNRTQVKLDICLEMGMFGNYTGRLV